jgi:PrgI family protein
LKTRIPADIEMEDRILAGLTVRQLVILSLDALLLWGCYLSIGRHLSVYLLGPFAALVVVPGLVVALAKPDGMRPEKLALDALRSLLSPKTRVMAPEGITPLPEWARSSQERIEPTNLPLTAISDEGYFELVDGVAVAVCRVRPVNFELGSESDKKKLVEGFGRFLNSLGGSVQFLVRSERADLQTTLAELEAKADNLPDLALEQASRNYALFLRDLASKKEVASRAIFLCVREPATSEGLIRLNHNIEQASSLLRGIGIHLQKLSASDVARLLAESTDPAYPHSEGQSLPTEAVRAIG